MNRLEGGDAQAGRDGVPGPPGEVPGDAFEEVRQFLLRHGSSDEEIARALQDDVLDLLVADRLLVPSQVRYDEAEVSTITGMPLDLSRRFWRALGFPDPRPDDKMFTELDIEAIRNLESMVELGLADVDTFLQLARVVGSSMARIADAEVSPSMFGVTAMSDTSGESVESARRFARAADRLLPATARLLEFVWRRHVQAAVRRAMTLRVRGESSALPALCIGFADMVGFTALSQQLSEEELAAVVSRFEEVAHDVVTSRDGRVVKMIGDEAMFVTESTIASAGIGLGLAEAYADDDLLSDVRVALAVGPVLVQDGDYYGPVVNLAKRVVEMAHPGSVLVTDEFHDALLAELSEQGHGSTGEAEGLAFSRLRLRYVKDVGRVQLWSLYRPGAESRGLDRRLGRRWERLSEALQDLDELRDRGEKIVSTGLRVAAQIEPVLASSASEVEAALRRTRPEDFPSDSRAAEGGDPEPPQIEGPVEAGERPAPQVD